MTEKELIETAKSAASVLAGKGLNGFDVYVRASSSTSVEVRERTLDAFEEASTWGVGIRALRTDSRMGFAFSTGSPDAGIEAARQAVENASIAEPDEYNVIAGLPTDVYPDVVEFDETASSLTEAEKIDRAVRVEAAALDADPRIKRVRKASASYSEAAWAIVSSNGLEVSSRGTYFSTGVMAVAESDGESQMGYDFDTRRRQSEIDYAAVGRAAAMEALSLLGARKPSSGLYPVILDNRIATEFLGVLASSFSAEAVIKGRSLLADKVGTKVCSELINIHDDGLMPGGAATRSFDDEGIPCRRTPLIVEGVFRGFLQNTYTAAKTGSFTTGNAARGGFRSQPTVGLMNLYIERGDKTPEELVGSVKNGLLVNGVLGMHTANPVSGDFSVGVSGMWITDGKTSYPVREAAVSGNILDIFAGVEAVGSDLKFMGRMGSPSLLLRPLSISGS